MKKAHAFLIDCVTHSTPKTVSALRKLKSTIDIRYCAYFQDRSVSQIYIETFLTEEELEGLLYTRKDTSYIGVVKAPVVQQYLDELTLKHNKE